MDDAISRALASEGGPFILSESADSTGSGSPGDGAHVLERLLALGVRDRCLATVVDAPETVNDDPYGEGWLVRIRMSDPAEADALLDLAAYREVLAEQ